MATLLKAAVCVALEEDGVMLVGFADDESEPNEHLLLQKSCEPDDQDRALGLDQVYIEYVDQLRSAYGGILQVRLRKGTVDFFLSPSTASMLETGPHVQVTFPSDDTTMASLRERLGQMFNMDPGVFVSEIDGQ